MTATLRRQRLERPWLRETAAWALYLVAALHLTWPWPRLAATHTLGLYDAALGLPAGDVIMNISFGGWLRFAALELHQWPLAHTPWLMWPVGASHGASYDGVLFALATALLDVALPLLLAGNLAMLLGLVLAGGLTWRLARRLHGGFGLPLALGLAAEWMPYLYQRLTLHPNLLYVWVLPAGMLAWERYAARPTRGRWLGWVASFALMAAGSYYLAMIGLFYYAFACAAALWRCRCRRRTRRDSGSEPGLRQERAPGLRAIAAGWVAGIGLITLLMLPMLLHAHNRAPYAVESLAEFSAPLAQYLMPAPFSPLGRLPSVARLQAAIAAPWEGWAAVPPTCLAALCVVPWLRRARRYRFILPAAAFSAALVSLGPWLGVAHAAAPGEGLALPTWYLMRLTHLFGAFRVPGRMHVLVFLCGLVALGFVLAELRARVRARVRARFSGRLRRRGGFGHGHIRGRRAGAAFGAALAGVLALHYAWCVDPAPTSLFPNPRVPAIYERMARAPEAPPRAVFDVPWDYYYYPYYNYYQFFHRRPLVSATLFHDGVQPRDKAFLERPANAFFKMRDQPPADDSLLRHLASNVFFDDLRAAGIEYLVVHEAHLQLMAQLNADAGPTRADARRVELIRQLESVWRPRLAWSDARIRLYRTQPTPADASSLQESP